MDEWTSDIDKDWIAKNFHPSYRNILSSLLANERFPSHFVPSTRQVLSGALAAFGKEVTEKDAAAALTYFRYAVPGGPIIALDWSAFLAESDSVWHIGYTGKSTASVSVLTELSLVSPSVAEFLFREALKQAMKEFQDNADFHDSVFTAL